MNVQQWKAATRLIEEAFYEALVDNTDCGPFDGGCLLVAQALKRVIGGEIYVIVDRNDTADHAAVFKVGKLWDWDGPTTPARFIARFNRTEHSIFTPPERLCAAHRPFRACDLLSAARDAKAEDAVVKLFEAILSKESI